MSIQAIQSESFPELAESLRGRIEQVVVEWIQEIRLAIPGVEKMSDTDLRDNLPNILDGMVNYLSAANGAKKLTRESPLQGSSRFHQHYNLQDLMHEDRLLRAIISTHVDSQLGRRTSLPEQIALDMSIDIMLQQAVVAYMNEQTARIRSGAENELKYLSFLSHDLNNNLGSVTLFLQVLRQRLADFPEFAQDVPTLDQTQESILNTIGGMGRLLQAERLRKAGVAVKIVPINLHRLASNITQQATRQAEKKGLRVAVDIPPNAIVNSDGELITLALQNLLSNAIK